MSELLRSEDRQQLSAWIGKNCDYELLYKISRDGCSATLFHQRCDNKGPTVTVLYNTNNTVYGGYLSQSWHCNGEYIKDENAFMFRLYYNGTPKPAKIMPTYIYNAGYGHPQFGPTFGSFDMRTFSNTVVKSDNVYCLNGSFSMGSSYNMNGETSTSIANDNLQVTDLEVYSAKVADCSEPIHKPS